VVKSKIKIFYILALINLVVVSSCDTNDPPADCSLTLKLEEVSCTEAWITLTITNIQLPATVTLKQTNPSGNTKSQILTLNTQDSLLYIDSLLPNKNYTFSASHSGLSGISSNELNVLTLDTTTHNVSWQSFEFGEHGASFLWDVAIIEENNIWAVGEIYLKDSLGINDPKIYNVVHWDGNTWSIKRVEVLFRGNTITPPLNGVMALSSVNIWLVGSLPINGDGQNWQIFDLRTTLDPNISLSKTWGKDPNAIYFTGNAGSLVYYSGIEWKKIESGTDTRINDVYGIESGGNNTILYCPVSSYFIPGDKKILKIIDQKVDSVSWNRDIRLNSAWAPNENILYVCGEGNFVNKFGKWEDINLYPGATNSVRGNGLNDIFIVGDNGSIFHFNGMSWQMLNIPNDKGYSRVTTKGNMVVICGNHLGKGLIEVGIRN
jgi:hypothetical protein